MNFNYADLKTLAVKVVTGANIPTDYSREQLEDSLRHQLISLTPAGDMWAYNANKATVFRLIAEVSDAILPMRTQKSLGVFAEIKQFAQGERPIFTRKTGALRAKQFITRVAPSGRYEAFKLDTTTFEVSMYAIGGAAHIEYERYLDGHVSFAELVTIINDGFEDAAYIEVQKALMGAYKAVGRPAANNVSANGFIAAGMNRLINTARAYGGATIFCGSMFAANIAMAPGFMSEADKDDMRNQGYVGRYMGAPVVVLPNSFTDESNTTMVINPAVAYVMPGGANDKVVSIAFEGGTQIRELQNQDWSFDIQVYRKMGVALKHVNHFGIYEDTSLLAGSGFTTLV